MSLSFCEALFKIGECSCFSRDTKVEGDQKHIDYVDGDNVETIYYCPKKCLCCVTLSGKGETALSVFQSRFQEDKSVSEQHTTTSHLRKVYAELGAVSDNLSNGLSKNEQHKTYSSYIGVLLGSPRVTKDLFTLFQLFVRSSGLSCRYGKSKESWHITFHVPNSKDLILQSQVATDVARLFLEHCKYRKTSGGDPVKLSKLPSSKDKSYVRSLTKAFLSTACGNSRKLKEFHSQYGLMIEFFPSERNWPKETWKEKFANTVSAEFKKGEESDIFKNISNQIRQKKIMAELGAISDILSYDSDGNINPDSYSLYIGKFFNSPRVTKSVFTLFQLFVRSSGLSCRYGKSKEPWHVTFHLPDSQDLELQSRIAEDVAALFLEHCKYRKTPGRDSVKLSTLFSSEDNNYIGKLELTEAVFRTASENIQNLKPWHEQHGLQIEYSPKRGREFKVHQPEGVL